MGVVKVAQFLGITVKTSICAVLVAVCVNALAQQNLVVNGGFEDPQDFLAGWNWASDVGGLLVSDTAAEGQNFSMISGILCQDLATSPGQVYQLRYAMAGHPYWQGPTTLQIYWGGTPVASSTFDTTGHSNENLGWAYITNYVQATASNTRLGFNHVGQGIPYLDAVSVIATDLPANTCTPAPEGMVSWWLHDSNAFDTVWANHGAFVSTPTFVAGMVGPALLCGSNQCMVIPHSADLTASNYTIEAWVKPLAAITNDPAQAVVFAQKNGHCQLLVRPGETGLRVALQFATDTATTYDAVSTAEIPLNEFSHIAGTWDGTVLRLYINGILAAERTPGVGPVDSGCSFYIGGFPDWFADACRAPGQYFEGVVDEVSYYARALGAEEIQWVANAGSLGKCRVPVAAAIVSQPMDKAVYPTQTASFSVGATGDTPLGFQWRCNGTNLNAFGSTLTISNVQPSSAGNYSVVVNNPVRTVVSSNALLTVQPPPPCADIVEGLVSWWRAENNLLDGWGANHGTFALNSSGRPGVWFVVAYAQGKVGQAFGFGTNCMIVADAPSLRMTNGLTIEGWINPASVSASTPRTILAKFDPPTTLTPRTNSSYYLGLTNGHLLFLLSGNGSGQTNTALMSPHTVAAQQWSHAAATYDGESMCLYLNGALVAQTNYSGGIFPGTSDLGVAGIAWYPNITYWSWAGWLDEITLYNRGLPQEEVMAIYQADLTGKCLRPPVISAQPKSQAVPLGEDVRFAVEVLGTKPLRYQWRFNGQDIPAAFGSALVVEKVQPRDAGQYSVLVASTLGAIVSSNATLSLLPAPGCTSILPGLVSWWPEENSGFDPIGGNHATPYLRVGGYQFVPGKIGRALNLAQTNRFLDTVYAASNSPSLNVGSNADFSFEAWIKAYPENTSLEAGAPAVTNQVILQKRVTTSGAAVLGPGYMLSLYRGHLACWLSAVSGRVTNSAFLVSPGPYLIDSLFHHVALTVDRHVTGQGNLYVDGQSVLAFNASVFIGTLSNGAALVFGVREAWLDEPMNGVLDEVALYNRALTADEVRALYQAGAAGKCPPPPTLSGALVPGNPPSQNVQVGLAGIPGRDYTLERSELLPGSWSSVTLLTAGTNGACMYIDTNAPLPNAFYRARAGE